MDTMTSDEVVALVGRDAFRRLRCSGAIEACSTVRNGCLTYSKSCVLKALGAGRQRQQAREPSVVITKGYRGPVVTTPFELRSQQLEREKAEVVRALRAAKQMLQLRR